MPYLASRSPSTGLRASIGSWHAFQKGGAAAGGNVEFYVADPADMPKVETEIVRWGDDAGLDKWLAEHGIKTRPFAADGQNAREVILVGQRPAGGDAAAWRSLAQHIARGSTAVFLCPSVFAKKDNPVGWVPLVNKGQLNTAGDWLYPHDPWTKKHPIFDGLPCGNLMDYIFYRELISNDRWMGLDAPAETVAASINASFGYDSGTLVSVHELGAGRFILNTLAIRPNLGGDPPAERLLRNLLRYAARDAARPAAELPANFAEQLKAMGYLPKEMIAKESKLMKVAVTDYTFDALDVETEILRPLGMRSWAKRSAKTRSNSSRW